MTWRPYCECDLDGCDNWPCKDLREYRLVHAKVTEIVAGFAKHNNQITTVRELLDFIETECYVLCK